MSELYVDSVIKTFGTKQVLTDIFLTCTSGEIIGLLGRNGAGKSTLLKIIFGSLRADQKYVRINDKRIIKLKSSRGLIAYLHQDNFIPGHVRVRTLLSMLSNREAINELAGKPILSKMIKQKVADLSGGEKRIIEIFLTIYSNAKFVLLDEPFNGISPRFIDDIKEAIVSQAKNKAFILTDHDYRNIVDVSSRIILLHDGGTREINDEKDLEKWGYVPKSG